jgi:hypothetical protein
LKVRNVLLESCIWSGSVNPSTKSQLLFNKIKISTHIPLLTYFGQHNE